MENYIIKTDKTSKERFEAACAAADTDEKAGIGTLGEMGIHRTLKYFYEPDRCCHEVTVGGYVADIVSENGIIEIQSGSFGSMKKKLSAFLEFSGVTVVYPCVVGKKIIMLDPETGEVLYRRSSPKKGGIFDLLGELWGIADLLDSDRLEVRAALIKAEELRERREPSSQGRRRRRKNYIIAGKRPTEFLGEILIRGKEDYGIFLPEGLPELFTTADMRRLTGLDSMTACSAVNLLCRMTVIERTGKRGKAYLYRRI